MATRRVHIRPPGVKTGSTVGPFGPFRGTLGIHWVLGSVVVGLIIVLAGSWFLFREPGPPFEPVESFTFEEVAPGTAKEALSGIYLGRMEDGRAFAVVEPVNCPLEVLPGVGYVDCAERRYAFDGAGRKASLTTVPFQIHQGAIYIDPSAAP